MDVLRTIRLAHIVLGHFFNMQHVFLFIRSSSLLQIMNTGTKSYNINVQAILKSKNLNSRREYFLSNTHPSYITEKFQEAQKKRRDKGMN